MKSRFERLHTFSQPEVSVYSSIYEGEEGSGVDLYFFPGDPSEPVPSEAMAVIECSFEPEGKGILLIAKIFDEEQVGSPDTSAMHTLVMDVDGNQTNKQNRNVARPC